MSSTFVRVLGSADWHQTKRNDHSCYIFNDKILVDACSNIVQNLFEQDIEPADVSVVCFTHMHADHYMGLAPLLHHHRVVKGTFGDLTIVGPKATVRAAFDLAFNFIFHDSVNPRAEVKEMPVIIEIEDETCIELEGVRIETIKADHAVPGLCYRMTDTATGASACFTGDTRFRDCFGRFFKDADLLLHEVSFGAKPLPEFNQVCRHSNVYDAIRVCEEAGVRSLLLTHTYEPNRAEALEEASRRLSIPVKWALPYQVFSVPLED